MAKAGGVRDITWAEIAELLKNGEVPNVPAGTDLEEFLWQTTPESRGVIEARNPGRSFKIAAWAKKHSKRPGQKRRKKS